ncbi:matrix metalloproteinase-19 isoform X2 [Heterocephalus glaber]|uniref:Matrix metalloproteinase-14 n=1 Tax=Heterocephalus glaber TaxID=10181 RepID=A0AAX6PY82_HETGA|nr:matrix metalloproteinase-19 isoform X2 [Heterocephalus glaber]
MWWQLWLGFLLPMTVSGRALGPAEESAVDYLLQYGYLQKPLEGRDNFRPEDVTEALRAFQEASELPVSGQLDDATRARMRLPRCGLEDPFNQKTLKYLLLGRVLAHADIPELGSVHFDEDELWTEGTYRGVNLRIIAAHELGHALGLGHSRYTQALMAPVYAGYRPYFELHSDDVAGIQALYGKKNPETRDEEEEMEVPTVPPVPRELSPMPSPCSGELDAMMLGPHGKTYAFKGDYVWTVTDSGLGPLFLVSDLWNGLPGKLDAAVYSPRTQWIHFFKGDKVWRYINFKMSPGFPTKLNKVEPNLDAALYWPVNQKVFLFKGSGYWQWDELAPNDFSRYPKPIKELFTGVPNQPSAAMSWRDGRVYFFKGVKYWRLNRQLRVEKGYPRNTAHNWMHCHPHTPGTTSSAGDTTPLAMDTSTNADTVLDVTSSATDSTMLSLLANVTFPEA